MARINSSNKGKSFERVVSKVLTERFPNLIFQRVLSSGAFLGGKNTHRAINFSSEKADSFIGDIFCSNRDDFRFTIECKSYAEQPKLSDFFLETFLIIKWFSECVFDCEKNGKDPILIFKFNRSKIMFATYTKHTPKNINLINFKNVSIGVLEDLLNNTEEDWWVTNAK